MFHFMEAYPWLDETPDKWITAIMEELRPAARSILDYDAFRKGLLKCGAAVLASIMAGDDLYRANQKTEVDGADRLDQADLEDIGGLE